MFIFERKIHLQPLPCHQVGNDKTRAANESSVHKINIIAILNFTLPQKGFQEESKTYAI